MEGGNVLLTAGTRCRMAFCELPTDRASPLEVRQFFRATMKELNIMYFVNVRFRQKSTSP
ncbi:MAG: hypothetical protein ACI9OD_004857 [Limisphaerales bacterium]